MLVFLAEPASKDEGWTVFRLLRFKNQGDRVSYVATHGRIPPAGKGS